jgi:hypothetical protein
MCPRNELSASSWAQPRPLTVSPSSLPCQVNSSLAGSSRTAWQCRSASTTMKANRPVPSPKNSMKPAKSIMAGAAVRAGVRFGSPIGDGGTPATRGCAVLHHARGYNVRKVLISVAAVIAVLWQATPASATVHEIVGQWCSGRGDLLPPGLTGGSNADNFAQPLFATGFASIVEGFDPDGGGPLEPGVLIAFDFDHPASKIVGLGFFVQIDELPDGTPVYVEAFVLDTSHGFAHCERLNV